MPTHISARALPPITPSASLLWLAFVTLLIGWDIAASIVLIP
ncbi:MAG: hypothetical protein RIR62_1940 [Pseudomonadota bacterium]|jgi:hypothetical protein